MPRLGWIIVAGLVVAVGGAAGWLRWKPSEAIDPSNQTQVALGGELYRKHCASCHGAKLEGQPHWQERKPNGALPAPPHDASGHTWHHPDDQLFAIIKHGMARFAPPDYKTEMPAFVGSLTDADIRAVLAYIKSSWPADIRQRQAAVSRR
ncbi:MAG: c-type cytochrome [Actinomycetota bacterium]